MKKTVDATRLHYRELNESLRAALVEGASDITVKGVRAERYIRAGFRAGRPAAVTIEAVPGNDLAAFMNAPPAIRARGNAQDAVANTISEGKIIIEGDAGDALGYSMRGGKLFVLGKEVAVFELADEDWAQLKSLLDVFAADFQEDLFALEREEFIRLEPVFARPYGRLYAY